jgi:acyl-CoA thioesterase-1
MPDTPRPAARGPTRRRALLALAALCALPGATRAAATPLRIVMLGDSLTAGLGLPARDAIPAKLQALLVARGHDVVIVNAGVSGDTVAQGLARLDWALGDRPDAVIVALGANDMLRGIDPAATRAGLDALLGRIRARGLPMLVCGMMAGRNLGPAYAAAFDPIFPDLAARYDALLYPFLLDGVALDPALNQRDGIHPNPAGAAIVAERLVPKMEDLIGRISR